MAKKERNPGSVGRARAKRAPSVADQYEAEGSNRGGRANLPSGFDGRRNMAMGLPAAAAVAGKDYSPRPTPRPVRGEMDSSPRPTPRPYTMEERGAAERGDRAAEREAQKYDGGGRVRTTRRMPSGAQQYVRESAELGPREMSTPTSRRMKTIDETIRATGTRNPEARGRLIDAFIDESMSSTTSARTERQALDEDRANRRADRRGAKKFADGGMVTGSRAQISGTKFSGTF